MEKIITDREGYDWIVREGRVYNNSNQDALAANINHEIKILNIIRSFCGAKYFIDIGAHTGYYSVRLIETMPNIIAIEMIPANYEALFKNIYLNKHRNESCVISLINVGLWKERITGTAFDRGMESCLKEAFETKAEPGQYFNKHEIQLVPLNEVLNNVPIKDAIVKIDTDGADLQIMQGASNLLNIENSVWVIEHHARMFQGNRKQDIIDLLMNYGFDKSYDVNEYEIIVSKGFFTSQLEKIITKKEGT